jgi:hypothetical protein
MKDRPIDPAPAPLPNDWLPEAQPPQDSPVWDARVAGILAAADPVLRMHAGRSTGPVASSWTVLGDWWKSAAVLAAASTGLLVLLQRSTATASADASLSLSVVAAGGDPLLLWGAAETPPDPVLALIAAEADTEEER